MAISSAWFRDHPEMMTSVVATAIKDQLPNVDFNKLQIFHNPATFGYKLAFGRDNKLLGHLEVEDAEEIFEEVTLAKIMLMCG